MSYSNQYIISWMDADHELALRLDRALKGVKDSVLEKGQQLNDAFTRATWYSSCFTDNYQDVCSKLSNEDVRFLKALVELVKRRDIITYLIRLYVENYFHGFSEDKITKIARELSRLGAHTASGVLTSRSIVYAVTSAIAHSFAISSFFSREKIGNYTNYAIWLLTAYSYVDKAAKKADELHAINPTYYRILYSQNVEMLYFLVEPVLSRNNHFSTLMKSERELAEGLYRLMQ